MKKKKLSTIEILGIVFLLLVALVAAWYFFFYQSLQDDISEINTQSAEIDQKISLASAKLSKMNIMQSEIDEIFEASEEPSEVAVFDNYQAVYTQLNAILSTALDYSIGFSDPQTDESGIVRRNVSLTYKASSYAEAKNILMNLENNHWRCIVNSVSFSGNSDAGLLNAGEMSVSTSIVFFESTNIQSSEATETTEAAQ